MELKERNKQIAEWAKKHPILAVLAVLFIIGFFTSIFSGSPTPQKANNTIAEKVTAPATTTQTKQEKITFSSPDKELLFEINLGLGNARQSSTLSAGQSKELADIDLQTQDTWNKEMGYYVNLSPTSSQKLSDFQVETVLQIIQNFRKSKSDKWFDVGIFDDPAIAQTARKGMVKYAELSDAVFCGQIFSHFRGAYSWNPTNQHEEMNITSGCDWRSIK